MKKQISLTWRLLERSFWLTQKLQIFAFYEWLSQRAKQHRPLSSHEREIAHFVYGDSIDLDQVRIDEYAKIGPKQYRFCYVSFNTINSWGKMSDAIFIHELVHVWQYQHFGANYIPRALWAQRTQEGYNYGGVKALKKAMEKDQKFWEFNYEQQGDIVADYFRLTQSEFPCWGRATPKDLWIYEHFICHVRDYQSTNKS